MNQETKKKANSDPERLNVRVPDAEVPSIAFLSVSAPKGKRAETTLGIVRPHRRRSVSQTSYSSRCLHPVGSRQSLSSFQQDNLNACCVAGEHLYQQGTLASFGGSGDSTINVDISDLNGDEEDMILAHCLHYCHKVVLRPFTLLLLMMGWRPFMHGVSVKRNPGFWKVLNWCYPVLVFSLILYYDTMLLFTCPAKKECENTRHQNDPLQDSAKASPYLFDQGPNLTMTTGRTGFLTTHPTLTASLNRTEPDEEEELGGFSCYHQIPIYIVPALLHMVAYLYGFFHFRIKENEQIYSLMEKVFIRSQISWGVHLSLVKNSRILLFTVIFWMSMSVGLEMFYNFTYPSDAEVFRKAFEIEKISSFSQTTIIFLVVMKSIGFFLLLTVHVAVLFNYSSQCEMLIMYINGLVMWLREKSLLLKEVLHEILGVREYISVLNGALGKMTAICIINYVELTLIGICFLFPFSLHGGMEWTYRIAYPLVWTFGIAVPFVQGARLTKAGQQLRQVSFEMKVFGYQNCSQLELDSFVLFVSNATLRAKLFGIPVRPAILLLIFGGTAFLVLIFLIFKHVAYGQFRNLF